MQNCGAEVTGGNFCSYCGAALTEATPSVSLLNKAVSTANDDNQYSLVLVSCGTCSKVTTGDLLEDVFGYTDAESANLVNMAPVVVGERLNANEARTVAQMLTEYGVQVSITNQQDQYVDMTSGAASSVFDAAGNLLAGTAAIIGALTVSNRIRSYRRYKKPSLLERIFHIGYQPQPPVYRRNFRPKLKMTPMEPRRTIKKNPPQMQIPRVREGRPHGQGGPQKNHGASRQDHSGPQGGRRR